jgi:hypothetical protein
MHVRKRSLAAALVTVGLTVMVTGCSSSKNDDPAPTETGAAAEQTPSPEASDTPTSSGSDTPAPWAEPISRTGDLIGTGTFDSFTVEVYQVAIQPVEEDSMWVDPDTNENLLSEGDPVVFINYVFTNTSTTTFPLGSLAIDVSARWADWPYMQGMPGESHSAVYKDLGLTDRPYTLSAEKPYEFAPGESFNVAGSYIYQDSKDLEVKFGLIPLLPNGDLDHDNKISEKLTVTVK